MSNILTLRHATELRTLYAIAWRDGRVSGGFESPEAAAESVDAQAGDAPLPGCLSFDGQWLRDEEGRVAEIVEVEHG